MVDFGCVRTRNTKNLLGMQHKLKTIRNFHLDNAVKDKSPNHTEVSAFHASETSGRLFLGMSNGHILVFSENIHYVSTLIRKNSKRIFYLVELTQNIVLSVEASVRISVWRVCKDPTLMYTRKVSQSNPEHVRHVLCRETSVLFLFMSCENAIVIVRVNFENASKILVSQYFRICYKEQLFLNFAPILVCDDPREKLQAHDTAETFFLSVLMQTGVLVLQVSLRNGHCKHSKLCNLLTVYANADWRKLHFSWRSRKGIISEQTGLCKVTELLCISNMNSIALYEISKGHMFCKYQFDVEFIPTALTWVNGSILVAFDLNSSQALLLDYTTGCKQLLLAPRSLGLSGRQSSFNQVERWRYDLQCVRGEFFICCLPKVTKVRLIRMYENINSDPLDDINQLIGLLKRKQFKTTPEAMYSAVEIALHKAEIAFTENSKENGALSNKSRNIYFFRISKILIEFFAEWSTPKHQIETIYSSFESFGLGKMFIFLLEFVISSGKVKYLPNALISNMCHRFTNLFDEYLVYEVEYLEFDIFNSEHLLSIFKSGQIYRLEKCLAHILGDVGFIIRKALQYNLYRLICTQHMEHLSDSCGPLRKLRTIGTPESLRIFMEYVLLASKGEMFFGTITLHKATMKDIQVEAALHLKDVGFCYTLLCVDVLKYLVLLNSVMVQILTSEELQKVLEDLIQVFDERDGNFIPNEVEEVFWHLFKTAFVQKGFIKAGSIARAVAQDLVYISKLYEKLSSYHFESTYLLSQQKACSPFYPIESLIKHSANIHAIQREYLFSEITNEDVSALERFADILFYFSMHPSSGCLKLVKEVHECILLDWYHRVVCSQEEKDEFLSVPSYIQTQFPTLFIGIRIRKYSLLNSLVWALESNQTDSKAIFLDAFEIMLSHINGSIDERARTVSLFLDYIEIAMLKHTRRCTDFIIKCIPHYHFIVTDLLQKNPEALALYCVELAQKGYKIFKVCKSGCDLPVLKVFKKAVHNHTSQNGPCSMNNLFTQSQLDVVLNSDFPERLGLISVLLRDGALSIAQASRFLSESNTIVAEVFSLTLGGNIQEACFAIQEYIEALKNSSPERKFAEKGHTVPSMYTVVYHLQEVIEAINAFFFILETPEQNVFLQDHYAHVIQMLFTLIVEDNTFDRLQSERSLYSTHYENLLRKWVTEHRAKIDTKISMLHDTKKTSDVVSSAIQVIGKYFMLKILNRALHVMSSIEIWKGLPESVRYKIAPFIIQETRASIQEIEESIYKQESTKQIILQDIDEGYARLRDSQSVYIEETPATLKYNIRQLVSIAHSYPCGHIVESLKSYLNCPLCSQVHPQKGKLASCKGNSKPCSTVTSRLKRFRDVVRSFLPIESTVQSFIRNAQRNSDLGIEAILTGTQVQKNNTLEYITTSEIPQIIIEPDVIKPDYSNEILITVKQSDIKLGFGE